MKYFKTKKGKIALAKAKYKYWGKKLKELMIDE